MAEQITKQKGRGIERFFLLLVTIVLYLLFFQLYQVLKRDFVDVNQRLAYGTMVNLNDSDPGQRIKTLLQRGYYFEDGRDIDLISATVAQGITTTGNVIDNIGELNKRIYDIDADKAFTQGGETFKKRVLLSRSVLGYTGSDSIRFVQERTAPQQFASVTDVGMGHYKIKSTIVTKNNAVVPNVLVRLQMIVPQDSLYSNVEEVAKQAVEKGMGFSKTYVLDSAGNRQLQNLTAYARTDAKGVVAFVNLPDDKAFEVLPLQPGYQFGASQGVQKLTDDVSFTFRQAPHTIRLLSSRDFSILKKEKSLIVRTPKEFIQWYWIIGAGLFFGFLFLHIVLSVRFPQTDQLILPVLMILIGLSFITLLSLQDPLRDRFLAKTSLGYFGMGVLGIFILLFFNLRRFTTDSGFFRLFVFKNNKTAFNGWPWAALAATLLLLTILFGTGPEGSGVKVNLFGFQPSEVVKFLIVVFLAGFFAANEKFISDYTSWQKRWSFFSTALIIIVLTILLFLILGDLGPAMVVCFTFIILFSFSRGDFFFMIGAVVLYVLCVWGFQNVWLATGITAIAVTLAILFQRKQLSESAVMALVVIAGFLLLDQVPYLSKLIPGPVQRLVERKAIWQNAWDNEVFGGDQVANGIWAMASGGISGQGIGEGFAKTIPEAHTDMILPSIGEEFGWAGIIAIFILFLIYLHRCIIIGRQTGTPFLFYLCSGIGISTFVQFLLIAGGSTGALPLSGVSLPFISYGGSSLVVNLLAAGFLLSASLVRGTAVQMKFITTRHDKNLLPALIAASVGIILLGVNVSRYLFNNQKWVVQPSLVADRSGARMFSYNPRIVILMNKLQAGTLYDRDGRILATSKPELVRQQSDSLRAAGMGNYNLDSATHKRLDRYYPFAEQMFFWTGDANTGIFNGSTNGYFAEYEHGAELRGFKTPTTNYDVIASHYREDRFLPRGEKEMTVSKRDYSALAPLLLAGINSKQVEDFKKRNRDVQLTMDARLQTNIQKSIATDDSLLDNRVSVVIMEDNTGDVLASAMYPLPAINNWDQMTLSTAEQNKLGYWVTTSDLGFTYATQPGSTAKVATALAAFNKLGVGAAKKSFLVRTEDRIRASGLEPDETGTIDMERAIVKSNNVYFIRLANEEKLQEEMATLYMQTGMFLHGVGGYFYGGFTADAARQNKWRTLWRNTEFRSSRSYNKNDIRRTRGRGISGMAWGQGELIATPAAVARLASGVANNGFLIPNRYVLKISDSALGINQPIALAKDTQYAHLLTSYMREQSAGKKDRLGMYVAGKTGTPERIFKGNRINDGWYVFFAPKATGPGHVVVCIRIEATKGSSDAVKLAGKHIIPFLLQRGYIKSFDAVQIL